MSESGQTVADKVHLFNGFTCSILIFKIDRSQSLLHMHTAMFL